MLVEPCVITASREEVHLEVISGNIADRNLVTEAMKASPT